MRIDKFLWCVRLYKTRSLATDGVRHEQVKLNNRLVKASAEVKVDDVIALREPPIWRSWAIIGIPVSRVGPKLVPGLLHEQTRSRIWKGWNSLAWPKHTTGTRAKAVLPSAIAGTWTASHRNEPAITLVNTSSHALTAPPPWGPITSGRLTKEP